MIYSYHSKGKVQPQRCVPLLADIIGGVNCVVPEEPDYSADRSR